MAKKTVKRSAKKAGKKAAKKTLKKGAPKKKASKRATGRSAPARPMVMKRDDLGAGAEVYLAKLDAEMRDVAEALHETMMRLGEDAAGEERAFACALKWGYPAYTVDGVIVAQLYDTKAGMAVRFMSGMRGPAPELDDPAGLLDTSGKMPCVRIATVADADSEGVRRILASAVGR